MAPSSTSDDERDGGFMYETKIDLSTATRANVAKFPKKILGIYNAPGQHWVGDGFPVRSLFSYNGHGMHMSPFLLLDYAGPASFTPTTDRRGVGEHPHRGFETANIVYLGEAPHRAATGPGG